jgi:hypothetical protein
LEIRLVEFESDVVTSTPMKRQWFELGKKAMAGTVLGVEMIAMLETFDGVTRLPEEGRLARALDMTSIQPELFVQVVGGIVKFPLYVEPAARTIVSPQVEALMALWKLVAFPDGTLRIQLEPVVNVGQAEVPCVGRVRFTVFCGNVG